MRHRGKPPTRPRWRRWLLRLALLLLILATIPPIQVLALKGLDPPLTPLMLQRQWSNSQEWRGGIFYRFVALHEFTPELRRVVLASEDQRFMRHAGFDWKEMRRAVEQSRQRGVPARGASTVTMQTARSLFLWQGRSWLRKGLEAYYTFWMELLLDKRRIFELYLNVIETGDGVYGMEAAARTYFGKPALDLTDREAVWLAALLPDPRTRDPRTPGPDLIRHQERIERLARTFQLPPELSDDPE